MVYSARLLAADAQNDLGLIVTDLKPLAVAPLRPDVKLGENVSVFGFPLSDMLASSGNFTVGYVSALAGLRDDSSNIQISAQIQPGNSGGPVLDRNGNVVAVVVAVLNSVVMIEAKAQVPQNVNFAIKTGTALNFLNANGVKPTAAVKSVAMESAEIAEVARAYTVKILCNAN
jgi:S1-C subfamily serine protease